MPFVVSYIPLLSSAVRTNDNLQLLWNEKERIISNTRLNHTYIFYVEFWCIWIYFTYIVYSNIFLYNLYNYEYRFSEITVICCAVIFTVWNHSVVHNTEMKILMICTTMWFKNLDTVSISLNRSYMEKCVIQSWPILNLLNMTPTLDKVFQKNHVGTILLCPISVCLLLLPSIQIQSRHTCCICKPLKEVLIPMSREYKKVIASAPDR